MLAAVRRGLELPAESTPELKRSGGARAGKRFETRLRHLCKKRDRLAAELGIEPSVLAPRAVLERALASIDRGEAPERVSELREWQASVLRPAFEEMSG